MITPEARDLFLQVFCRTLDNSDVGPVTTMQSTDWGRVWIACCGVADEIAAAQGLADLASEVITEVEVETTPDSWPPPR